MQKDDVPLAPHFAAANDNPPVLRAAEVDAAVTRIAEAIGRHIAREHIRVRRAANDNESLPKKPRPPKH